MITYVTTAELKSFLGLSGSSYDTVLAMLNKFATDDLNQMLSVSSLALHKVTGEVHSGNTDRIETVDMHIRDVGTIMDNTTEYTQDEAYDIDENVLHLEFGLFAGYREVTIDYAAGWNASGFATITIDDYSAITAGSILTVTPQGVTAVTLAEGTAWNAATSNDATAASLADAIHDHTSLGGSDTGIDAFAIGSVVYIVDKVPQQQTSTISINHSNGMTFSGGTLTGVDFPEGLRETIMLLVAGRMAKRRNTGMKSYTIGTKTVTFADDADYSRVKAIISHYKRAKVFVV